MLVLSLFPGIGLLDSAFELEGFCVVRGPDVLWGGDIRNFHPPAGKFDGVIGGPPCQCFSRLANIVRHNGRKPKFGNLIPEFQRCVAEAKPTWFVMENVREAPLPEVAGYGVFSALLNNRQCIDKDGRPAEQNRIRRWSFGFLGERLILPVGTLALENPRYQTAALGGHSGTLGRADRRRVGKAGSIREYRTGTSCLGMNSKTNWAFAEICAKQGLPQGFLKDSPFTVEAKCKMVGNGVPIPIGRAIAQAVKEATMQEAKP
jgi:DNA (cytosine-5)-methyltransferase 1